MKRRLFSFLLSAALLCGMLPGTALAWEDTWIETAETSTITFKIVNGTWKDLNLGSDASISSDGTIVTIKTYKYNASKGYVYLCGGYMESMLAAILGANGGGSPSDYITPDEGYTLNGMTNQAWAVESGGLTGSSKTAYEQMTEIKNNIHGYDTHQPPVNGFDAGTVYILTLTKSSYSVTGTIDHGTVTNASQTLAYQDSSADMVFTPAEGYAITGVTVNGAAQEHFELEDDGTYTYPAQAVTGDITVAVTTTLIWFTVTYEYTGTVPEDASALPEGGTYTLGSDVAVAGSASAPGYLFDGWYDGDVKVEGTFAMPARDVALTGSFTAAADTAYTVEHYKQDLAGTGYDLADTEHLTGTTGTTATVEAKTYEGFTFDPDAEGTVSSGIITGSGTLVLKLYYTRNSYQVTYSYGRTYEGASALPAQAAYKYGETVTAAAAASAPGYTFTGWTSGDADITSGSFTMPAKDVRIIGSFTKKADLTVEKSVVSVGGQQISREVAADTDGQETEAAIPAAKAGDEIVWRITVTNTGEEGGSYTLSDSLKDVKIYDENDREVDLSAAIDIAAGGVHTYFAKYTVTESDEDKIVNTAAVKSGDKEKSDDAEGVDVADIDISKSVDKTSVNVGDTLTYTITLENTGTVLLTDIEVKEIFTGDVSKIQPSALPVAVTYAGGGTFTLESLQPGASAVIRFTYAAGDADTAKGLRNTAVVSTRYGPDKDVEDEASSDDVTVTKPYIPPIIPGSKPTLNYEDHVAYIIGYEDGTVKPENNITRAEVATIFFRLLSDESRAYYWTQSNGYTDVTRTDWYNNAVSTLANADIITGYPDGTFRPNAPITRAEFAAIAARFSEVVYNGGSTFTDVPVNHWAARFIALAEHLGWINGYPDGSFKPNQAITRAEAMTLINRVLERAVEKEHLLPGMVTWADNRPGFWYYEAVQEATNSHEYVRLSKPVPGQSFCYEDWTAILPAPDWAALEKVWSSANSK